jgi:hypothetical protein
MVLLALPGSLDLEVKTGSAAARAPQRWLIGVRPQAALKPTATYRRTIGFGGNGSGAGAASVQRAGGAPKYVTR